MYDVNPLGPMMHLKELDRQAVPTLRQVRSARQDASSVAALGFTILSFLRGLRAVSSRLQSIAISR